jgi:3-dehydroquinate synthase
MPSPRTVRVNLAERSYDILIGRGLLASAGRRAAELFRRRRCAVVTDSNVAPLYAEAVLRGLTENGIEPTLIKVPSGETSKSLSVTEEIGREMIRAGLDRHAFLIALGGGVIGDLAGFAASIFLRGIPFIQVPTTLLSQVDSSVGGKTGVNTPEGKNLIGTFAQPALVLADVDTLQSLPRRVYCEGFAEIIKHAAIRDESMFDAIDAVAGGEGSLTDLVKRNVQIKARIVEQDEHETTGERALLNFGHTIGHAIEASAGYGELFHGEAIALGMIAAARLSEQLAGLPTAAVTRLTQLLKRFDLPTQLPGKITTEVILGHLKHDKKFSEGKIRFVLLRALGDAFLSHDVTGEQIADAINGLRG